ncbi:MAG TPA: choice-of-anchor Q domain-containing protein [Thermoleophilaceae bacterium]
MRLAVLTLLLIGALAATARAATITVTSTADSTALNGQVSLREALESINAAMDVNADVTHAGTYGTSDTIIVPPSSVHYAVAAGELLASKNVTINGAGPASTVLDAGGASRVLHFTGGAVSTISGVTITGGDTTTAHGGAGILSDSPTLNIANSAFTANTATITGTQTNGGGALWLGGGGTIDTSSFTGNTFTQLAGLSNSGGGAIFNSNLGLTVTNSSFADNSASITSGSRNGGGAIYQDGSSQTLTGDSFTNNSVQLTVTGTTPQLNGGGATYQVDSAGALTIGDSTFGGNSVSIAGTSTVSGGGAVFHAGTTFTLTNSTLSANTASPLGGAAQTGGGAILTNSSDQLTITNSTIDGNSTSGAGGNILAGNSTGTIVSENTILAGGSAAASANCGGLGTFASTGHNLEDTTPSQCGLGVPGDQVGVAPLLGPLGDNGGPNQTRELLPGSPAINAGDTSGCPTADERGIARPQGPACDIGALEVDPPGAATGQATAIGASSATLAGSAANPNSLIGGSVFFQFGRSTAYGSQTPAQVLGAGVSSVPFSASVTGLPAGTVIHFRAVATTPDGMSLGADASFTTKPRPSLSRVKIAPSSFRPESGRGASIARRKGGAFVRYKDSQAATTTFTVQARVRGFRSGRRCVAKRPRGHGGKVKRCTLYRSVGAFKHKDHAGSNRFHFSGRAKRRGLRAGRYRLHAVALTAGLKSAARNTNFRIL